MFLSWFRKVFDKILVICPDFVWLLAIYWAGLELGTLGLLGRSAILVHFSRPFRYWSLFENSKSRHVWNFRSPLYSEKTKNIFRVLIDKRGWKQNVCSGTDMSSQKTKQGKLRNLDSSSLHSWSSSNALPFPGNEEALKFSYLCSFGFGPRDSVLVLPSFVWSYIS